MSELSGALRDPEYWGMVKQGLTNALNRGVIGGALGAPVDIANMALGAIGAGTKEPIGGSEWIGKKMQDAGIVNGDRNAIAEILGSFVDPATAGAGVAKLGALASGKLGALGMAAHTAWHGSPHLFDKFKNEAIGTGEGAQTYGHGLYLAEHPDVAKNYMNHGPNAVGIENSTNSPSLQIEEIARKNGIPKEDADLIAEHAFNTLYGRWGNLDSAKKSMEFEIQNSKESMNELFGFPRPDTSKLEEAIKHIDSLKKSGFEFNDGNNLYKTDIPDTHIDKMLDWDKPLSEQTGIHDLLAKSGLAGPKHDWSQTQMTGGEFIKTLTPELQQQLYTQGGIPGIKYLDGSSRSGGEGTRNFVMFNPDDIRILERNGQATGAKPWADDVPKFESTFAKYGGSGDINESLNIPAKSQAFADMAEAEGFKVAGRGDKYVTLTKSLGKTTDGYDKKAVVNVRISDHSNVNRSTHFGEHDINIAPDDGYDRHTFDEALQKLRSVGVNEDLDTVFNAKPILERNGQATGAKPWAEDDFARHAQAAQARLDALKAKP